MRRLPTDRHRAFRDDMIAVLKKHAGDLDATDMLALAAHLVGQLVAMQDQRKYTPPIIMEMVGENIEQGNREAMAEVAGNPAGHG